MTSTSLWRSRHRVAAHTDEPFEESPWDVVVIGAGLTGMATALLLARSGASVLVVEARHIGAGTTGGSTAKVSLLQGTTLSRMSRRQSDETVAQYVRANQEALAWVDRYAEAHGVALQKRSAFTYATTDQGHAAVEREMAVAEKAGLPVSWSETPELPFATRGAVRLDEQSQVDPLELLGALAVDLRAHGGALVEGVRVRRVRGRGPLEVETDRGTARAGAVVVATNMPILDRGGFFARATAQRSYAAAFAAPDPVVQGMYLSADSPSRSLRSHPGPDGDLLLVGGNGHPTGRGGRTGPRVEDLRAWTAEHFGVGEPTHVWSAQDYVTASGVPFVGPAFPGRPDLLVAGGYAKWGMTNAVAGALVISAGILGGRVDWAEVFDPWSRHQLAGAPDAVRYNAEVGLEMTRGWLQPLLHRKPADPTDGGVRYDGLGPPTASCHVDGRLRRSSAVCPHLGGIVRWNDAEQSWDCPLHGSRFEPEGEVLEGPATSGLRSLSD